jgi:hypothetical protein
MIIRLVNGTRIELKGADKPDTLRGVGLHLPDHRRGPGHQARHLDQGAAPDAGLDARPGDHHRHAEVVQLALRPLHARPARRDLLDKKGRAHQHLEVLAVPDHHLAVHPQGGDRGGAADMDEKSFRQEFEASFETMSGRVYYAFDRNKHVGDYPFNPKLPIWIGQDFNIDPMSSVIMQPQPNGEVWIVDECVLHGSNTQETADELARATSSGR